MDRIEVVMDDITQLSVDAIVNAANSSLLGGGGVDGAIHRAAGSKLLEACRALGGCATGDAKITDAFLLPCRYVIHTVGPVWHDGKSGESCKLRACYKNSMTLAMANGIKTIAFPAISTGAFGYPLKEATAIAIDTVINFLKINDTPEKVYFVCFSDFVAANYIKRLDQYN